MSLSLVLRLYSYLIGLLPLSRRKMNGRLSPLWYKTHLWKILWVGSDLLMCLWRGCFLSLTINLMRWERRGLDMMVSWFGFDRLNVWEEELTKVLINSYLGGG